MLIHYLDIALKTSLSTKEFHRHSRSYLMIIDKFILEWTTSLDTSSGTLFVCVCVCVSVCPRHVDRRFM